MNIRKTMIHYAIAEFASSKWKVFLLLRQGDFYFRRNFIKLREFMGLFSF